jgi:hypothetical protein
MGKMGVTSPFGEGSLSFSLFIPSSMEYGILRFGFWRFDRTGHPIAWVSAEETQALGTI